MLVLSRRPAQTILFPALGVRLEVLRVNGSVVKIGIEAPDEISVMRGELQGSSTSRGLSPDSSSPVSRLNPEQEHRRRNRLNKAFLAAHAAQLQVSTGNVEAAEASLSRLIESLEQLGADDRTPVQQAPSPTPAAETVAKLRALIVDDDANERELLAGILSMSGFDCDVAPDGMAALEYLESHAAPDFVLLDICMPRCDGTQTLQEIRKNERFANLNVIVISGKSSADAGIEVGSRGVNAWLSKPLNPRTLWDTMIAATPSSN